MDIQGILGPGGLSNFRVALDSVIFEDYQYLGSSNIFQMLQRFHPEIHK
jgi:hypothetical protein